MTDVIERPEQDQPGAGALAPARTRARDALAGFLGAATALVVIEIVTLFDATGRSVTETVQNRFINEFAGSLKETAVSVFGTNDKAALQIGTAIVVVALGALLGLLAGTRRVVLAAGFGAFAVLGIVVGLDDPIASHAMAVVAAVLGAVAGVATALGLERWWRGHGPLVVTSQTVRRPAGQTALARRTVLTSGGAYAVLLLAGTAVARGARSSYREAATAVKKAIPRPVRSVATPGTQPFDVAGISPYVTPTADFYRIDTAVPAPIVDADGWSLKISGLVDREVTFTYDQLLARALVEVPITIQCVSNDVGGDLIGTARWTGVPLKELLDEAGIQAGADQIMGESIDGFTAGFPVEAGIDGRDSLLALGMNGHPLTTEHGFPARLIIPGLYGYVSATKWITQIRLTTFEAEQGYWVPLGWSAEGPIKLQSRIDVPRNQDSVPAGRQAIGGVAWAPHTGVKGVQVKVDDGRWGDAQLGSVASVDTWVQWRFEWDAAEGDHEIAVRAIDADGKVQTSELAMPAPDGATGHHTIRVTVSGG